MGRIPTNSHFASRGTGQKGKMKTIYLVCLVVAGAALARAWGCPGKISPTCIPIFKPVKPGPGPTPVNCPLCEVRAIAEKLTNPSVHVPICAGDVFRKYQYDKATKERFCVTRDGEEIPKSRKKGIGNPAKYCDAFPIKDKTTPAKRPCDVRKKAAGAAGAFISCQKNGYYAPVQKRQNWRWCVTRDGQPVPMTMSLPIKKNWGKANCARFRNFRYQCKKRRILSFALGLHEIHHLLWRKRPYLQLPL